MNSKITIDTNVLVRILIEDDQRQMKLARAAVSRAELVAITTSALCELNWVLRHGYKIPAARVAESIRGILTAGNIVIDRAPVEAGLAILDAGGDFADGVITFEGERLGAEALVSFDKKAVKLLHARGMRAELL